MTITRTTAPTCSCGKPTRHGLTLCAGCTKTARIALENIAAPFSVPGNELTEAEFLSALVDRTGCGVLLDLTNLLYNARNEGRDPCELVSEYPLEAVAQ